MKCPLLKRQIEKVSIHSGNRSELKEHIQSFEDCIEEDCTAWGHDDILYTKTEYQNAIPSCQYNRIFGGLIK